MIKPLLQQLPGIKWCMHQLFDEQQRPASDPGGVHGWQIAWMNMGWLFLPV
jgi:hypothetical protein